MRALGTLCLGYSNHHLVGFLGSKLALSHHAQFCSMNLSKLPFGACHFLGQNPDRFSYYRAEVQICCLNIQSPLKYSGTNILGIDVHMLTTLHLYTAFQPEQLLHNLLNKLVCFDFNAFDYTVPLSLSAKELKGVYL